MHKKIFLFLCFLSLLFAEEELRGIFLFEEEMTEKTVEGVRSEVFIPEGKVALENRLQSYFGKPLNLALIENVQNVITAFYQEKGFPFVIVEVPEQKIAQGTVQYRVLHAKVGRVTVEGNRYTQKGYVKKIMGVSPGDSIDENQILAGIDFLNRSPFRQTYAVFSPGKEGGSTDVTFGMEERAPLSVYAGAENNGVVTTGRQRWYFGFSWAKAIGIDSIFSYQYTSSTDFDKFQAHTLQYLVFLPNKNVINIFGGYTHVNTNLDFPSDDSSGYSLQGSLRYIVPMPMSAKLNQELIGGFDYKRTNSNLEFVQNLPGNRETVNLTQFVLGYKGTYELASAEFLFQGEVLFSPFRWLTDQTSVDYNALYPGAVNRWIYGKGAFSYTQLLPGRFVFYTLLRGQGANTTLLPSEQYGIGGIDTVRGYDERELNKDDAILTTVELRTPATPVVGLFWRKVPDSFQFLAFWDYGVGWNYVALPEQRVTDYLMGVGPGIRYTVGPNIRVRVDWGITLHRAETFDYWSRLHFNAVLSF